MNVGELKALLGDDDSVEVMVYDTEFGIEPVGAVYGVPALECSEEDGPDKLVIFVS
jgi:hypothetical protein